MPRNMKGGKHKHIKKRSRYNKDETLLLASDQPGSMYAIITKKLGTSFEVSCSNGKTEYALIRGKFRNKVWMNIGDIVLINKAELDKYHIIHKYTPDQARQLKAKKEITFDVRGTDDPEEIIFEGETKNSSDEEEELFHEFDKLKTKDTKLETEEGKNTENNNTENNNTENNSEDNNSEDNNSEDNNSEDKNKLKNNNNSLINKNKIMNKFKNKTRGGRQVVRQRGRAAARDRKGNKTNTV